MLQTLFFWRELKIYRALKWPDKSNSPGLEMLISPICSLIHVRNVRLVYIAQPSLIVAFLLQLPNLRDWIWIVCSRSVSTCVRVNRRTCRCSLMVQSCELSSLNGGKLLRRLWKWTKTVIFYKLVRAANSWRSFSSSPVYTLWWLSIILIKAVCRMQPIWILTYI